MLSNLHEKEPKKGSFLVAPLVLCSQAILEGMAVHQDFRTLDRLYNFSGLINFDDTPHGERGTERAANNTLANPSMQEVHFGAQKQSYHLVLEDHMTFELRWYFRTAHKCMQLKKFLFQSNLKLQMKIYSQILKANK